MALINFRMTNNCKCFKFKSHWQPCLCWCFVIYGCFYLLISAINMKETILSFISCRPGFCTQLYFEGPPHHWHPEFLAAVKERFMVAPSVDPKQSLDVSYSPYWKDIGQWSKIQDIIKDFFRNQPPGVFVEVGAVDGEFMSHTLYLEKYLNWTGLLIEPDPRSFQEMISKRNVWMSPMCINQNSYIAFKKFWLRTVQESLPHRYKLLFYSQSKLNSETFIEDEYGGSYIWIPCTWISVLLLAADLRTIDFLSISTGISDDGKVMDLVNDEYIDVKTLLVQYPVTRIADDPYPSLDGYIMDSVRSQQLVKFYVNLSHCNFLGNTTCRTYHYFDKMESCYSFMCFNNTIIRTFRPNLDIALKPVLVNDTAS